MKFSSNGKILLLICAAALLLPGTSLAQLQRDSLAQTPPMGWNSWNKFQCNVSEDLIKSVADSIATNGMKDAGYEYVVIDDCWQMSRDDNGNIVADAQRVPRIALAPQAPSRTAVVPRFAGRDGLAQRLGIHVRDHQHVARVLVGSDAGHEPIGVELGRERATFLDLFGRTARCERGKLLAHSPIIPPKPA